MRCMRILFVALLPLVVMAPAAAKDKPVIEKFKATSMNTDGGATMVEIGIAEWSTADERQELLQVLKDGGSKAVGEHIQKMKDKNSKGYLSLPNTMGQDLGYAYQFDSEGTRIIVVATNRPVSMGEAMGGSLSQDNNITFVNLVLDDKSNEGKGQLYVGARLFIEDSGKLAVKDTISASDLTKVKPEKVKKK